MLVLSRRAQQQIVFPHLGIRLSVLQVKGRLVKLGIEAPDSVSVLREELTLDGEPVSPGMSGVTAEKHLDHQRRNELNLLSLRLESVQRRIDRGELLDAQEALDSLLNKFSAIDHELDDDRREHRLLKQGRPIRLLVVEDSDNERQLMAYLLAERGFDVQVARDGVEALEQLQVAQFQPEFILMDMQMPCSDGLQTLLQIRADERLRCLKVFAVTGMARDYDNEPLAHSWDGWFQKPLNVSALVDTLNAARVSASTQLA